MKIALIGYGKMGKEIEKIALERNHKIELIIDIDNLDDFNKENLSKVDVAIDFSQPQSAYNNIVICFNANTPIVSGTTGWIDKLDEILNICKTKQQTFFYASNYSLGVNIFFHLNKYLAKVMNSLGDYNVSLKEIHHTQKLDAPSGTAISLAKDLIENLDGKNKWELDKESNPDVVKIIAIREGQVPGTHIIEYDSPIDSIEIKHEAKSRKGFALGAVLAAEFISDKKGYFTMDDMLNID